MITDWFRSVFPNRKAIRKEYSTEGVVNKMKSYAEAGFGDFLFIEDVPEQRKYEYFFITTDGKIWDEYLHLPIDVYNKVIKEKRFNEFKTKEDAEKVLNKLKNYARNKDYSGIEMGKAYFIHSKGIIYHSIFCAWNVEGMKSIGNWFKTKEEAEEALNKLKEIC